MSPMPPRSPITAYRTSPEGEKVYAARSIVRSRTPASAPRGDRIANITGEAAKTPLTTPYTSNTIPPLRGAGRGHQDP